MDGDVQILDSLKGTIQKGYDLIERLKPLYTIDGVDKLSRKIHQEIRFLEKVHQTGSAKKEHLLSTNLIHLGAIVDRLCSAKNVIHVMRPYKYQNSRLEVDVVSENGSSWIKVVARNAKALTLISLGNGEYGQKSILDQAESYLDCAKDYPYLYKSPKIIFHFAYGIEIPLAVKLESLGIVVEGERMKPNDENYNVSLKCNNLSNTMESSNRNEDFNIATLNLDVSTLLAYVSNMTNGYAHFRYKEPLLTSQAEWERSRPVKPILEKLFQNKELIVCRTAYDNFMNIIRVIGGTNETRRAHELMKRVTVVDDIPSGRIMERLSIAGKIKDRSRLVFATGENTKSVTVSANEGFVRAARMKGIECTVFLHEPRSLSEFKERYAERIEGS